MQTQDITQILRIDSSALEHDSVSRMLGDEVVQRLHCHYPAATIKQIDLAQGISHIDEAWVAASLTSAGARDDAARARLLESDNAVAALRAADAVVLTVPIYNFSIPSTLKAWIDLVCRPGLTFRYGAQGPQGLLHDRPVYLVMASGGVPFGSAADFASGYLRQVFHFVGIDDVRLIGAQGVAADSEAAAHTALAQLDAWLPQYYDNIEEIRHASAS